MKKAKTKKPINIKIIVLLLVLVCLCVLVGYILSKNLSPYLDNVAITKCSNGSYSSKESCITCPKGSYCKNNTRTLCAKGTYQDKTGQSKCISCASGYTTTSTGSKKSSDCIIEVTCTLTLTDNNGQVVVTPSNNKKIKGYYYVYGNTITNSLSSNKHTLNTLDNEVSVIVVDNDNNTQTITCNVIDKSTKQKRSYAKETYNTMTYMFYQPKISVREKAPLVIYYYGAAGLSVGLPKNLSTGADLPYYVVIPISNRNLNNMLDLIAYLTKTYKIDTNRIVVAGASAGTVTALKLAAKSPKTFSGAVVVSGMSETISVSVDNLTKLPIWFFQGTNDSYSMINNYVNKINKAGGNAKLTSYKGGHDAPNDAFLRNDLTDWILNNKK